LPVKVGVYELNKLRWALDDIIGYLSDNSCGDPECCGGPYYELQEYNDGLKMLAEYGIEYDGILNDE
jgi:hypothetical protein